MEGAITLNSKPVKGNILVINTGSTSSKFGYYKDGVQVCGSQIDHSKAEIEKATDFAAQLAIRNAAVSKFLEENHIPLEEIDLVMGRGGQMRPILPGVYSVNADMREVLMSYRDGKHASSLSPVMADDLAGEINNVRKAKGIKGRYGECKAYIADSTTSDEMFPEYRLYGVPEFKRESLYHALNSRAVVRKYLADIGLEQNNKNIIVCHMGGGVTISMHQNGRVIDSTHGLDGDGPITPERSGTCPALPLVEMCFSGKYTKQEIRNKIVGGGGAVAYFGTNDMRVVEAKAKEGVPEYKLFMEAFVLNIAKYIAALTVDVYGKVDALLFTGGIAYNKSITDAIIKRVGHLFPDIRIYPGENEIQSLAENGYMVLSGKAKAKTYNKNKLIED
jgi:butyrate kinase